MQSVLVVDPSETYFRTIRRILQPQGLRILHEARWERAIEQMLEVRPSIALIDAFGPEMDGFTLVKRLSKHPDTRQIPLIMMANAPAASQKVRALWFGAKDFLVKPFDENELTEAVRTYLAPEAGDVSIAN